MATRGRNKVWVRSPAITVNAAAASANESDLIFSLRGDSNVAGSLGGTYFGLNQDFTVIRLLGWWYLEHFATTAAAGTTNNPPVILGVRVAGNEELEELNADANFRLESGPALDPMADWLAWVPCYADNFGSTDGGASEILSGKGHFDIRSARRVNGIREDLMGIVQFPGTVPAGMLSSFRFSYAALCLV